MTARYWFKPKHYGYGATPTTWEGWVFTAVGVVIFAAVLNLLLGGYGPLSTAEMVVWWIAFIVVLAGFMVIAWAKTEGGWRWRWGASK
jgi:hypothetical protein